jgi:BASS family bile acid:Na+ symporter
MARLVSLAFQISLIAAVFSYGLRAELADLLYLARRPVLLVRSLVAVVVIMPAVAVLLARWFDVPPTVEIALVALAISPLPPLLPARQVKAGGAARYGLGLMVALAVLSIGLMPLAVQLIGVFFGRPYVASPLDIAVIMLTVVLAPLGAGVAIRAWLPGLAERIAKPIARVARTLLPVAIVVLVIGAAPAMWKLIGDGTLVAMAVFVVAGFGIGHLLGGPEPEHAAVLAFSAACRHPATALAIAAANYPERHFQAAVLLYVAVTILAGVGYTKWRTIWLRRH